MILFTAILLGSSDNPAEAVEAAAIEGAIDHSMNEEEKKEEDRLKGEGWIAYGGLQSRVRDGKRYGTGSVSDLSIDHDAS